LGFIAFKHNGLPLCFWSILAVAERTHLRK
jgi:hypothetical protein